jgi:hypothetical protein
MDAQQYDEARDRRRRGLIIIIVIAVMFLAWLAYHFRDYPERHAAAKFFATLTRQDLEGAYAIWLRDPNWKQHPQKYSNYTFGDFTQDWGPASEWGLIKNYSIDCSLSSGTGVIVQATLNQRAEHAFLYVDKSDRTLHFPPNQIECGNWFGWLTE